jgi:hypothetical protein
VLIVVVIINICILYAGPQDGIDLDDPDLLEIDEDAATETGLPEWDFSTICETSDDVDSIAQYGKNAAPADLLNLCKMKHGMSDRSALSVLALLKLGLDFSDVRQTDITKPNGVSSLITEVLRCRSCADILETDNCVNEWYVNGIAELFRIDRI